MKKINYKNAPADIADAITKAVKVSDFLPHPSKLVANDKKMKITIAFNKSNIDFFKEQAKKQHIPYQQMIRRVVELYVDHYSTAKN